jgi:hypothetical protein
MYRSRLAVLIGSAPPSLAVILDDDLLEDFVFAHHPTLPTELDASRKEYEKKGGLSHEAMKKRILRRHGLAGALM